MFQMSACKQVWDIAGMNYLHSKWDRTVDKWCPICRRAKGGVWFVLRLVKLWRYMDHWPWGAVAYRSRHSGVNQKLCHTVCTGERLSDYAREMCTHGVAIQGNGTWTRYHRLEKVYGGNALKIAGMSSSRLLHACWGRIGCHDLGLAAHCLAARSDAWSMYLEEYSSSQWMTRDSTYARKGGDTTTNWGRTGIGFWTFLPIDKHLVEVNLRI